MPDGPDYRQAERQLLIATDSRAEEKETNYLTKVLREVERKVTESMDRQERRTKDSIRGIEGNLKVYERKLDKVVRDMREIKEKVNDKFNH